MFGKYLEMPAKKWLKLIENEKLRTLAIERTSKYPANPWLVCSSVQEALFHSFDWEKTEEGEYYWLNVYNSNIGLRDSELVERNRKLRRKDMLIATVVTCVIVVISFLIW